MTKQQIVNLVAQKGRISKSLAKIIVDMMFQGMTEELASGGRIEIRGFGSFQARRYDGYNARNPRTGADVEVKPKRMPHFKVGKGLFERLNSR